MLQRREMRARVRLGLPLHRCGRAALPAQPVLVAALRLPQPPLVALLAPRASWRR